MKRPLALAFLVIGLPLWTGLLLMPNPVPPGVREFLGFWDYAALVAAKSLHASAYAVFTFAALLAIPRPWHWLAVALIALHGAGTEIGQRFVPGRSGTWKDVGIDTVGVLLGWGAWFALRHWLRSRRQP